MTQSKMNYKKEKQKVDKTETIDDLKKIEQYNEYQPEIIKTPDYDYWNTNEPLNWQYQVRNIPTKIFIWNDSIIWTWIKEIKNIWFIPSYIEIFAQWSNIYSEWYYKSKLNYCLWNNWTSSNKNTDNIIYLQDENWNITSANINKIWNWKFILNITQADISTDFIYKCYW